MANTHKKSNLDSINEEAFFVHKQTFQAHIPNAANLKCELNIQKKETKTLNKPNLISLTLQYHQGHLDPQLSSLPAQRYHIKNSTLKHSHPGISIHILHTVLSTFPMVLTKKFCLTINQELSNLVMVYYFYYSYDLYIWFKSETVTRN